MTDWKKVLKTIAPKGKASILSALAGVMPELIDVADLSTPRRIAHFLAQIAHESDGFHTTVEYASGAAYEGRKDLGNTRPGDGVRFKGRGLIQVTGRANYATYGDAIGQDIVNFPDQAAKFPAAALTAAHYWKKRSLNADADADDIVHATKKINGGRNGLAQRAAYLKAAKRALASTALGEPMKVVDPETQITAAELRAAGSRTIAGADAAKQGLAGSLASIGGATAALSQVQDVASQAQEAVAAVQSGVSALETLRTYWPLLAVVALTGIAAFFVWRAWRGTQIVTAARVDDAATGLNIGR